MGVCIDWGPVFWGRCMRDPTILGPYLVHLILGYSHIRIELYGGYQSPYIESMSFGLAINNGARSIWVYLWCIAAHTSGWKVPIL